MLTARDLMDRHGVNSTDLHRWRERGWIVPSGPVKRGGVRGSGPGRHTEPGSTYPRWCDRMVALLADDLAEYGGGKGRPGVRSHEGREAHHRAVRAIACALEACPDVPFVVVLDSIPGHAWPCQTAEQVRAALDYAYKHATIVAVPA